MRYEFYVYFIPQFFVSRNNNKKKIHKMNSGRGDLTLRRHLARENINRCHRRWATERSLGNWVRLPGSNPVLRLSGPDAPDFSFSLLLSPLSFYICRLASPESKSHWRSSAYSRLATTLIHLERTRANIRYRSVSVISSLACDSKNIKYFSTLKKYKQKKKIVTSIAPQRYSCSCQILRLHSLSLLP